LKDIFKIQGKVEIAEEEFNNNKPYIELITRLCYLDYPNLNGVGLSSSASEDSFASIVDMPIVAKINNSEDGFKGHEVKIDKNGNINFGTSAYGTNVEWYIKNDEVDVPNVGIKTVPCYFAKSKVWKRYPKVISIIKKYMDGDGLYSSWELQGEEYNDNKDYKDYIKFTMLANALIGVAPAYGKNSKTLQVASENNEFEREISMALSEDVAILSEEEKKKKYTIDNSKESAKDGSWSDVDLSDIKEKVQNASNSESLASELGLILKEDWETNKSNIKYPHHVFDDNDTMILHISGCQAAWSRFQGENETDQHAIDHIKSHYKELELNMETFESSREIKKGGNKRMGKVKTSAITLFDLYQKASDVLNPKGWNSNPYYVPWMIYPEDRKILSYNISRESEDEYIVFNYTIENDEMSIDEGTATSLSKILSEKFENIVSNVNIEVKLDETAKLLSQKEIKISELEKDNEKLTNEISEKTDALIKAGEELETLKTTVSELTPFKEQVEEAEKVKLEAETAQKRENLKKFATKGGFISEDELESSEEIKKLIEDVDEKSIKAIIAERVIQKLDIDKGNEGIEISSTNTNTDTKTVKSDLNSEDDGLLSAMDVIKMMLKNK